MDLVIAVRIGSNASGGAPATEDVAVQVDREASRDELARAIGRCRPGPIDSILRVVRTGALVRGDGPVAELDLRWGDVVEYVVRPSAGMAPPAPAVPFVLRVVGGPSAGAAVPLVPGSYIVGRDASADITLQDLEVSRRHVHLGVGEAEVAVSDLGSTNGTIVDGRQLSGSLTLRPGQVIAIGRSLLTVVAAESAARTTAIKADGATLAFNRPPRVTHPPASETITFPSPPVQPPKRKMPLTAALVPIATGAVMSLFLGPVMLLFAFMGPVMVGATLIEDRRSGRHSYAGDLQRFRDDAASLDERVKEVHERLVHARRAEAPDPADLLDRVRRQASSLWERRLRDSDALDLRLGTAHLPSRLRIDVQTSQEPGTAPPSETAALHALEDSVALDPDVPVDIDLRAVGVLGVAGEQAERDALLRWLVLQTAILHSPREVGIVALVPESALDAWQWVHWLPHTETLVSGLPDARTVAARPDEVRELFGAIDDLITSRRIQAERRPGSNDDGYTPTVFVVIPGDIAVPRPALARVLADGPAFGVVAVVGAPSVEHLPGECRAIMRVALPGGPGAEVTVTASGDTVHAVLPDGVPLDRAVDTARLLAPVRDVSAASATGALPRRVLLLDLLEMNEPTAATVQQRWRSMGRRGGDLGAPIGIGPAGPVSIDLRRDGPHALAAGTTGSGKSEFLQSLVASLAATYPASVLTFVLIDYKGGAAFKDCVALPHTVGFFTDLDAHLAERALVSLNAELRRREEILREHGAKDLIDLERRRPQNAPANLFLVFDEFAFLKKEVPAFVAGVIDIAQRGRSLGVHLMLATQRPSGVVDDNIRANTNLRIALRIADESDSNDVIDRPDAARISKSLPGRVYIRSGQDVQQVQSAYANARSSHGPTRTETTAVLHELSCGLVERTRARSDGGDQDDRPTDLQRLVEAIVEADRAESIPAQPHPWLDPLPELIDLATLQAPPLRGPAPTELSAVLGLVDLPERQAQDGWAVDLGAVGHLLVYGASGAGKTTAVRNLVVALAQRLGPTDLHVYGLDFASRGLVPLTALPHCGGIVTADDPERVERLVTLLERIVRERRVRIGDAGASSLSEYRAAGNRLPYVVVLIDGFGALYSTYLSVDHGELLDRLGRLVAEGRSVGLHLVITADRRGAIPTALSSVVPGRLVLRMADSDEYASLGLPTALGNTTIPAGRGFVDGGRELQLAVLGSDASGAGFQASLGDLAAIMRRTVPHGAPGLPIPVQSFSDAITVDDLALAGGRASTDTLTVAFGQSGASDSVAFVDVGDVGTFAVFGPDRSGRTNALAVVAAGLMAANPTMDAYLLAPRRTRLTAMPGWTEVAAGTDACDELARRLADMASTRQGEAPTPWLVVIDDGDELADTGGTTALAALLRRGRDCGLILLAAAQTHTVHRSFGGWLTDLRKAKHAMLLMPDLELDGELVGARLPKKSSRRFPTGRGYLVRRGEVDYVQVALLNR